jgi:hypothetical protein
MANSAGGKGFDVRLGEAARTCEGLWQGYEDEKEVRDAIILAASDAGYSDGQLADWARISRQRVQQIIARRAAA